MPAIEESLRNIVGRQDAAFSKVLSETSNIIAMLENVIRAQEEQARQEFTVTTTTTVSPANTASVVVVSKTPLSPNATALASKSSLLTRALIPLGEARTTSPMLITALANKDSTPTHKLNRDIHTIPELWRLWAVGIGGAPSVEELDRQYGSSRRTAAYERQYYLMRKTLIDEVKRRTEKAGDGGFTLVVRDIEVSRTSSCPSASINKVIETLKAGNRARMGRGTF